MHRCKAPLSLRLVLIPALVALILSACRGTAAPVTQNGASHPTQAAKTLSVSSTRSAQAPTLMPEPTLTPLPRLSSPIIWYLRGASPADLDRVNDQLNRLLAARGFNAQVELHPVDAAAFQRRITEIQAAGDAWDLVSVSDHDYVTWIENGSLLPLSKPSASLLQADAPKLWASLPESIWQAAAYQGAIYAIPNQRAWSRPRGISIRADVVRALDLQPDLDNLHTYADLTPLLIKLQTALQEGTLKKPGVSDAAKIKAVIGQADLLRPDNAGYDLLAGPFAIRYDDPQREIVNWYQTANLKALATLRREWQQAGYFPDEPLTPDQMLQGYRSGSYLVELGHQVYPGSEWDQTTRYGYVWFDRPLSPAFISTEAVQSSMTGVNANIAKDPQRVQRVLLFLEWLHTDPEVYNLLAFGIQAEHWQWADQANRVITLASGSGYLPDYIDQLGDSTLAYTIDPRQANLGQRIRQWNADAPASMALGFTFDPRPAAAENYALQGLLPELLDPLANGQVNDVDLALTRLAKSLDTAGAKAVETELARQWVDWKKVR